MPYKFDANGNPIGYTPKQTAKQTPNNQAAPASNKTDLFSKADAYSDIGNYSYPNDLLSPIGIYGGNYVIFYINIATDSKLVTRDKIETVEDNTPRDRGDLIGMGLTKAQLIGGNGIATSIEGAIAGGLLSGNVKGAAEGATKGALVGGAVSGIIAASALDATSSQKRLKTAIALHIPNDLSINYGVEWSENDTAGLAMGASLFKSGSDTAVEILKALNTMGKDSDVTGAIKKTGGTVGAIATSLALSKGPQGAGNSVATGLASNPKKEQVFKGVNFRTFSFNYKFFPRSSPESQNVMNIIKEFKLHMHPEFKDANNFVYVYPSEFDITYYSNGNENNKIHRHTSCVLTDMSVNYTPNGMFNTFADGMPTQIDITLSFRELGLLTKDKIKAGL